MSKSANPMKLRTRTECEISDIDDVWNVADMDCSDEILDAIQTVRNDHSEEAIIESDIWLLRVRWNDNTDSVWVGRYGYNGGMEVDDGE